MFTSLGCVSLLPMKLDGTQIKKFVQYSVDSSEVFNLFFKGLVMSGITYVRTSVKFLALFVEKRRVIGWYAKINE